MVVLPHVTVLIAAYNERDLILEKVQNTLSLNYPKERLRVIVVTDGSTDGTHEALNSMQTIEVWHRPERKGKLAAVQRVMPFIDSPIVVFTDANCMLNQDALENIVRHYEDPLVGAVAGEKKIQSLFANEGAGAGEGLYWRYESWLKKTDSELYSVVGAAGELFSFRRELYEELPPDTIIEDFVLSMRIAMKGYRVVYEPNAYATELPSESLREEWKRKVRICAGGFQSLRYLPGLFNPFKHGWLTIQFVSHRFLRWAVVPFLLPVLIFITGVLAMDVSLYLWLFILEILFIASALFVLWWQATKVPKWLMIPAYLLLMNAAAYAGLWRLMRGSQSAVWEKAKRKK